MQLRISLKTDANVINCLMQTMFWICQEELKAVQNQLEERDQALSRLQDQTHLQTTTTQHSQREEKGTIKPETTCLKKNGKEFRQQVKEKHCVGMYGVSHASVDKLFDRWWPDSWHVQMWFSRYSRAIIEYRTHFYFQHDNCSPKASVLI